MSKDLSSSQLQSQFQSAFQYRTTLSLKTNAMRLVNGQGDGLPGVIIDRFHKHFIVQLLEESWRSRIEAIEQALASSFEIDYLIVKDRTVSETRSAEQIGVRVLIDRAGPQTIVEENGLRFHVDLNDHLNPGLFLDMRKNRRLVASLTRDKAVLNCFSYTCSFGVYCRHFGAARVVNVDISAKFLKRGDDNYRLNHLPKGRSEFIREHVGVYVDRAGKRNNLFDLIILDPPSFSRYAGKVFSVKKDLAPLIEKALRALMPSGRLFVSTNLSSISRPLLEEWAHAAARRCGRRIVTVDRLGQDLDFRGSGLMKESFLSALLVETSAQDKMVSCG